VTGPPGTSPGVVAELAGLAAGTWTSAALVEAVLTRLAAVDGRLHLLARSRAGQARADAAAADADRAAGRGADRPLLGLPVLVKESHAVAGMVGAWGTASVEGPATADAPFVAALRAAGAIVVGTTTMPELALWPFGVARNPFDPSRTAGGSSGGSAAAVAAGVVAVATATDGGGSIRLPAAFCGLVGLKVAPGQLPGGGGWHGLSVDGVLTRSVRDTAVVLDAVRRDRALQAALGDAPGSLRIGWSDRPPLPPRAGAQLRALLLTTLGHLRDAGHRVEPVTLPWRDAPLAFLPRYLRGTYDDRRRLAQPGAVEPRTAAVAALGARVPERAVLAARHRGEALRGRLRQTGCDLLLVPTGPAAPAAALQDAGTARTILASSRLSAFTSPFNAAGVAALSVPVGHGEAGLPLGVQLVAPDNDLGRLLAVAEELEAATGWAERRPPHPDAG